MNRSLLGGLGMLLVLMLAAIPAGPAEAFPLPGWGKARQPSPGMGVAPPTMLQEVAPPAAVQQLRARLAVRHPRVAITSPTDGALLPPGPWTLQLAVEDWPLVEAGSLGPGPHLLVQLDDDPPRRVTAAEVSMPPLSPGSHRLTVHAAWPWGEAVKSPGAWSQIRLHRVTANPLGLPRPGTPQLLAVSPAEPVAGEPVLIDWELIDAPLQHLSEGDIRWKLRITVNGDGFLVDRHEPLWLKGWRRGGNSLLLELVDPRGEPLNPPFNSLVREVSLDPALARPRWLGGRLNEQELAMLAGDAPSETPEETPAETPEEPAQPTERNPFSEAPHRMEEAADAAEEKLPEDEPEPEPQALPPQDAQPQTLPRDRTAAEAEPETAAEPDPEPEPEPEAEPEPEPDPDPTGRPVEEKSQPGPVPSSELPPNLPPNPPPEFPRTPETQPEQNA